MALHFTLLAIVSLVLWGILRVARPPASEDQKFNNVHRVQKLKAIEAPYEAVSALSRLVDEDGAGDWPPRVAHHDLPSCFQHYQDIYLELVPHLSTATPSLDDDTNKQRMAKFRSSMRKLLAERISISDVELALARVESGDHSSLTRAAYNGIYCSIAVCRHAYRWATIPVVKQAQLETMIDFPPELDAPWPYLQRHFGLVADSGNNTANVLLNFDENGERVYKINVGMSDLIRSSEEVFFRMFFDVEVLAFPIYYEMVSAIVAFEDRHKEACLNHLENVTWRLRDLLLIFYKNLKESRISHSAWLSYVQEFQGWGVGRMIGGEFIKYDGLSGNHVLFFQAVDAFLGLDRYLTDENMDRYIPVNQRNLCLALKKHSIRYKLHGDDDLLLRDELTKIVFRSAHKTRVRSYLEHPAPERLIMTAGKSVLENQDTKGFADAYKTLDELMATRLRLTV
ncbi:hypothetical protein HD806DRAFT_526373 [Xylariaceae sp. AK1471]|nr:hypothetical protein HD806DRAFT_526373 [Xylariaceae sp. AK1471]